MYQVIKRGGSIEKVSQLLKLVPVDEKNECARTGLFAAAETGNLEMLHLLLGRKASINVVDTDGMTPLLMACASNQFDSIRLLIENGADPTHVNAHGCNAVWMACNRQIRPFLNDTMFPIVKFLVEEHKIDPEKANNTTRDTPLHQAIKCRSFATVEYLIQICQVNPIIENAKHEKPYDLCVAEDGVDDNIKTLLAKVSNVGVSVYSLVSKNDHSQLQEYLEQNCIAPGKELIEEDHGSMPSSSGNVLAVDTDSMSTNDSKLPISKRGGVTPRGNKKSSSRGKKGRRNSIAERELAEKKRQEEEEAEKARIAEEKARRFAEREALRQQSIVKYLDAQNWQAMRIPSLSKSRASTRRERLMKNGKPRQSLKGDHVGLTGLMIAAGAGYLEILQELIKWEASTEVQSSTGMTALLFAAGSYGSSDCILQSLQLLLTQAKADISHRDNFGNSVLHWAALSDSMSVPILKYLIENGSDPRWTNNDGCTILHLCASSLASDAVPCASYLIETCGLDPSTPNSNGGLRAIDMAVTSRLQAYFAEVMLNGPTTSKEYSELPLPKSVGSSSRISMGWQSSTDPQQVELLLYNTRCDKISDDSYLVPVLGNKPFFSGQQYWELNIVSKSDQMFFGVTSNPMLMTKFAHARAKDNDEKMKDCKSDEQSDQEIDWSGTWGYLVNQFGTYICIDGVLKEHYKVEEPFTGDGIGLLLNFDDISHTNPYPKLSIWKNGTLQAKIHCSIRKEERLYAVTCLQRKGDAVVLIGSSCMTPPPTPPQQRFVAEFQDMDYKPLFIPPSAFSPSGLLKPECAHGLKSLVSITADEGYYIIKFHIPPTLINSFAFFSVGFGVGQISLEHARRVIGIQSSSDTWLNGLKATDEFLKNPEWWLTRPSGLMFRLDAANDLLELLQDDTVLGYTLGLFKRNDRRDMHLYAFAQNNPFNIESALATYPKRRLSDPLPGDSVSILRRLYRRICVLTCESCSYIHFPFCTDHECLFSAVISEGIMGCAYCDQTSQSPKLNKCDHCQATGSNQLIASSAVISEDEIRWACQAAKITGDEEKVGVLKHAVFWCDTCRMLYFPGASGRLVRWRNQQFYDCVNRIYVAPDCWSHRHYFELECKGQFVVVPVKLGLGALHCLRKYFFQTPGRLGEDIEYEAMIHAEEKLKEVQDRREDISRQVNNLSRSWDSKHILLSAHTLQDPFVPAPPASISVQLLRKTLLKYDQLGVCDGELTFQELINALIQLGISPPQATAHVSGFYKIAEVSHIGTVLIQDFVHEWIRMNIFNIIRYLQTNYANLDSDHDGLISASEAKLVFVKYLGEEEGLVQLRLAMKSFE